MIYFLMNNDGMIEITVKDGNVVRVVRSGGEEQEELTEGTGYTVFYEDELIEEGVDEE